MNLLFLLSIRLSLTKTNDNCDEKSLLGPVGRIFLNESFFLHRTACQSSKKFTQSPDYDIFLKVDGTTTLVASFTHKNTVSTPSRIRYGSSSASCELQQLGKCKLIRPAAHSLNLASSPLDVHGSSQSVSDRCRPLCRLD